MEVELNSKFYAILFSLFMLWLFQVQKYKNESHTTEYFPTNIKVFLNQHAIEQ